MEPISKLFFKVFFIGGVFAKTHLTKPMERLKRRFCTFENIDFEFVHSDQP